MCNCCSCCVILFSVSHHSRPCFSNVALCYFSLLSNLFFKSAMFLPSWLRFTPPSCCILFAITSNALVKNCCVRTSFPCANYCCLRVCIAANVSAGTTKSPFLKYSAFASANKVAIEVFTLLNACGASKESATSSTN